MTETIGLAILLVLIGGAMEGSFALPMQRTQRWAWENVWLIYSVVGLIVIPWIAAWITVPHLFLVYHQVAGRTLFMAALFGFGWGIANVLFGLALPLVGMAITFAVIVGM
ncbi:MAG TPA: L-rhamnose/proton symporter RhaT, partial [Candidatus Angelobacter sp.]|nr:L-rhamnose/proton symporter RhaT [Candidatus Angelobacter sp.]